MIYRMMGIFNGYEKLRMRGTKEENPGVDSPVEGEAIEASGDAIIIASAIQDLADAVREHARAMNGEDTEPDDGDFDLAGNRIA